MPLNFRIPVGTVRYARSDHRAIADVIKSNQLSPGKKCHEFKQAFAEAHGARYGLIVNSGTDALRIALAAMREKYGWGAGDQVLVPAVTFVATVNVVKQNNMAPVVMDAGLDGLNVDRLEHFDRCTDGSFSRNIRAVIPVHLCGKRLDLTRLKEFTEPRGIRILEDSCECMGVGPMQGELACYSTYVCHLIATGVGGLSITNDRELYELMWSYANHGRSLEKNRDMKKRFVFERIGYSSRATEFEAALGLEQLKRLPKMIKRRRDIAAQYIRSMRDVCWDWLWMPDRVEENHAYMMFPLVTKGGVDKWDLCRYLENKGIETRELLPLTNQPCYRDMELKDEDFYQAAQINKGGFYIGCHPEMTQGDVGTVIDAFLRYGLTKVKRSVK